MGKMETLEKYSDGVVVFGCPICRTQLVVSGEAYLETLDEHVTCSEVTKKPYWACPNVECDASKFKFMWAWTGDWYAPHEVWRKEFSFIGNNNAPFGSFGRKINIEVYKHDEDKWYDFKWFKIKKAYHYEADTDGNILHRRWKLQFYSKGGILYISGIRMLKFCLVMFYRRRRHYFEFPGNWQTMLQEFNERDRRWWKRVYVFWINLAHRSLRKELLRVKSLLSDYEWKSVYELRRKKVEKVL